jgi:hypothetical protein
MIEMKFNEITVPVEKIRENPWNPNEQSPFMYQKQVNSMREFGQVGEILVRELEDGSYQIIDGEHRWRAARDLGFKELAVNNLGKVSDDTAKLLTEVLNELHGDRNPLKMSKVLNDLRLEPDWERIQVVLPFTHTEVETMLALAGEEPPEPSGGGAPPKESTGPRWIDIKVAVHAEEHAEVEKLIARTKAALGIEKKPDPALENGALLKELVTRK